ncbi:MAG: hypothetical protein IPK94_07590 [Saprospiraceae bacterium]|nr:hypothetical protein [Saprospiraceae bacterium]
MKKNQSGLMYIGFCVDTTDEPYTRSYHVESIVPRQIIFIKLRLGFR